MLQRIRARAADCTHVRARRALLAEQVALVHEAAERTVPAPADRERLRAAHRQAAHRTAPPSLEALSVTR